MAKHTIHISSLTYDVAIVAGMYYGKTVSMQPPVILLRLPDWKVNIKWYFYSPAPEDFISLSQELAFTPSDAQLCVNIPIVDDNIVEALEEYFFVVLSSADLGVAVTEPSNVTVVIFEEPLLNCTIGFNQSTYTVREDDDNRPLFCIVLMINGTLQDAAAVMFATMDGTAIGTHALWERRGGGGGGGGEGTERGGGGRGGKKERKGREGGGGGGRRKRKEGMGRRKRGKEGEEGEGRRWWGREEEKKGGDGEEEEGKGREGGGGGGRRRKRGRGGEEGEEEVVGEGGGKERRGWGG